MDNLKNLMDRDVKNAVLALLDANGETSNKEIKDHLRSEGFYVTQVMVREYMEDEHQNLGLTRTSNGQYNVYTRSDDDGVSTTDVSTDATDTDTDNDDDDTLNTLVSFSVRQLNFKKDSNTELFSKMKNPKYTQYKTTIETILTTRKAL